MKSWYLRPYHPQEALHYLYAAATINKLAAKLYIGVYDSGFKQSG